MKLRILLLDDDLLDSNNVQGILLRRYMKIVTVSHPRTEIIFTEVPSIPAFNDLLLTGELANINIAIFDRRIHLDSDGTEAAIAFKNMYPDKLRITYSADYTDNHAELASIVDGNSLAFIKGPMLELSDKIGLCIQHLESNPIEMLKDFNE